MGLFDIFKKKSSGTFQLNIQNDILTNEQRQKYVFSCLQEGISLQKSMVSDLSLAEILSVVYATSSCSLSAYPQNAKTTQENNRGFMLSMAADWLKNNDFFVILNTKGLPIKMANNGVGFTCIYSTESMAEKAINGCKGLNIKKISANKPDFWKSLLANGIIEIVADNSPVTLTVQGCLIYSMAMVAESSDEAPTAEGHTAPPVKCNFTIEQQKEWLAVLSRTIPTIMIGGNPLCVDYYLHPRMLEEAGNMLNTVARIAFEVANTLSITNIEKALNTTSFDDLVYSYRILGKYSSMLKPPHCDPIKEKCMYILSVIKKINPTFIG